MLAIISHQYWPPSRSYPCNLDALCEFCENIRGISAPVRVAGCFFHSLAIQYLLVFVTTQHGLRRVQGIDLMRKYHHRPHHQVHTPDHKRKKPNTNVEPAHHSNVVTSWHIPPGMNTLVHINRTTCITRKTTTTTQQRKTKQKLKPSLLSLRSAPLCSVRHSPLQENPASEHACPHLPYNHARPVHTPALSAHSNQPHLIHRERLPTCAPPPTLVSFCLGPPSCSRHPTQHENETTASRIIRNPRQLPHSRHAAMRTPSTRKNTWE